MRPAAALLIALTLAACENPDYTLGATISNGGIKPSIGVSDDNIAVVVRP